MCIRDSTSRELLAAGAQQLGVAFLEEGIALRKAGVTAPILSLIHISEPTRPY